MKILITGANGQVGHCLQQQLRDSCWEFVALTRAELDISDAQAVENAVQQIRPAVIINAAAYTAVDKAEQELKLAFAINRDGPANLARSAKRINAAILHISTDYVFAGDATGIYSEDSPTAPQCVYGQSKLEGEQAVIAANDKHIILRTAWVFGEHGNNFVKTVLRLGRDRDQLNIVADQFGGPTYAGDIAAALLKIASKLINDEQIAWGIYHYSGHPYTSWHGFASKIFDEVSASSIYDKKIPFINSIGTTEYPTPAKRPANSRLSCIKIQQHFEIRPSDWKSALKNIRAYC